MPMASLVLDSLALQDALAQMDSMDDLMHWSSLVPKTLRVRTGSQGLPTNRSRTDNWVPEAQRVSLASKANPALQEILIHMVS